MKKLLFLALILLLVTGSFLAGNGLGRRAGAGDGGRKILYYVDPMNPAHTSFEPGLAPCGMKMEPVYADELAGGTPGSGPLLPGTVKLSLEKQQLIGVRLGKAEKRSPEHRLRLLGKVAVDETRAYQVTAPAEGWTTKAMPCSVGSFVKKDETLAMFYSPTFISAGQAFRTALEYQDRMATNAEARAVQRPGLAEINVKQYRDSLRNLGVSDRQIDDMIRTRQYSEHIDIVSPADGFLTLRAVSQGQRFEKGAELYRVADLSRVWVVADVLNRDAPLVSPGVEAAIRVPAQNISLPGKLSEALPQFDPVSRSLKLRFEAENPGYALKPDMFVDVEFTVTLPEALVVPAEAVVDSGLRKVVFVDRGNGFFEPRPVQTGWRIGDFVEILQGLMAAEPIVVSGNFLLDSESRMKLAASGVHGAPRTDPVCGMAVDETQARAAGRVIERDGQSWFFCADGCKQSFAADPAKFIKAGAMTPEPPKAALPAGKSIDPVCKMQVTEADARAAGRFLEHAGQTYYFCADPCKERFTADPSKYLKQKAATAPAGKSIDPVCGMQVTEATARAAGRVSDANGRTYYFCNNSCKEEFDANPLRFAATNAPAAQPHDSSHH